jgi:hypothetical protein
VKKKHTGHPVALEFEHLRAVTEGDYFTTRLYTLENGPGGVYRRATRSGQGSAVNRPGAFLARWGSGLIELVRDHALEQELRAAGLDLPAEPDEPARPAVTPEQPAGPGPPPRRRKPRHLTPTRPARSGRSRGRPPTPRRLTGRPRRSP